MWTTLSRVKSVVGYNFVTSQAMWHHNAFKTTNSNMAMVIKKSQQLGFN